MECSQHHYCCIKLEQIRNLWTFYNRFVPNLFSKKCKKGDNIYKSEINNVSCKHYIKISLTHF